MMQAGDPIAVSLLTPSLRLMAKALSHVAVYTLAALAAQDAPQAAIAQSLRIDAPPMLVGLAASQPSIHSPAASPHVTVAPPEVAAASFGEWAPPAAEWTASVEFSSSSAIAPAPLPQPIAAIAPPEDLDQAIALLATQAAPLWQPLSAPSTAIAPPEMLFEDLAALQPATSLFDPWIDAEELSLLDQEWSQLQLQDELWEWPA
ncbi:hypothetical protein O77CONTIG1_03532 [Leptolyngbya sp. O-77]|nr:hypothetical protein O77CONTIG1_03532 [Leptolyngbya sp. O-77]